MLKRLSIPLQAFSALFICASMAWMTFVVAGFNPTPPTAEDLQARKTQDLSFASMNSTAAALAFQMVAELGPSPIVMPVTGSTSTVIPTPTLVVTLRAVSTFASTNTPFSLFSLLFPGTATERPDRPTATPTRTLVPTSTPRPPTATATATATLFPTRPPTLTRTPSRTPTKTPTDVPPTPTEEPTITNTPIPTVLPTDIPTQTPMPTDPPTEEPTAVPTTEPTEEPTATPIPIESPPEPTTQATEVNP